MTWQFTPFALPLFLGIMLMAAVMLTAWQRRHIPGAATLVLIGLTSSSHALGYAMEIGTADPAMVLNWFKLQYIGAALTPLAALLLILDYIGARPSLTPLHFGLQSALPLFILLLAWSNEYHNLIWYDITLESYNGFYVWDFSTGPFYWVNVANVAVMTLIAIGLLARERSRAEGLYRKQASVMLAGLLLPLGVYAGYILGIGPAGLDITPFGLIISAVIVAWGMLYYHIVDIMPIARDALLAGMSDMAIVLDHRNRLVDINAEAEKMLGVKKRTLIGHPAEDVFSQWRHLSARYISVEKAHDEITVAVDDEARTYDLRLSTIYGQNYVTRGRLLVLRDITDRVRAETELRKANTSLETLRRFDAELNQRLDTHYVAETALKAAEWITQAEVMWLGVFDDASLRIIAAKGDKTGLTKNQVLPAHNVDLKRIFQSRKAESHTAPQKFAFPYEFGESLRNQLVMPLLSREKLVGLLVMYAGDETGGFAEQVTRMLNLLVARVGSAIDNSQMYEERQTLVNELDSFAQTVAHDLKSPLSLVTAYGSLLEQVGALKNNPDHEKWLALIVRNGHKAGAIIDALLMMARIRRSDNIELEAIDTASLIHSVKDRFFFMIEEEHVTFTEPESWPSALAYGGWIEEIWANYISNAIKYGGEPPEIELGYDMLDGEIRFWVKDNGKGISREQQEQLFQPFNRLDRTDDKGHGLGLSIVQRIAERFKGRVGVESEPGKGSCFYFTLPATTEAEKVSKDNKA